MKNIFKAQTQAEFNAIAMVYVAWTAAALWLTHVIFCFSTESYIMLVVGALAFPLGILHGLWILGCGFVNMVLWVLTLLTAAVANFIGMF